MWSRAVADASLTEIGCRLDLKAGRPPYRALVVEIDSGDVIGEVGAMLLETVYADAERMLSDR